jgi:hypothetical protein
MVGYLAGTSITGGTNGSSQNTFIGSSAGSTIQQGTNNIIIGYNAQASTTTTTNNEITLGNSSIATLRCQVTSITSLSDIRDKKDIEPINIGIDFINELNPVKFTWDMRDGGKVGVKSSGFIAQELQEVQNKFNIREYLNLVYDVNPDKLEATYGNLLPVIVKAIQDLSKEQKELEEILKGLENK